MATPQPARSGASESMAEFVKRRNREQAARGQAKAAAHQSFGDKLRAKAELDFPTKGGNARPDYSHLQPNYFETPFTQIGHPGLAESFVPVWGSTRESLAELVDGRPLSAAVNAGWAATDFLGVGEGAKLTMKGGAYALRGPLFRTAKEAEWRHVRKQMRDVGLIKKAGVTKAGNQAYEEGHHWLIPQHWTWVPKPILNHPFNIHSMDRVTHARLRHSFKGLPRYNPLERYWHGTPRPAKVATVSATGHVLSAASAKEGRK